MSSIYPCGPGPYFDMPTNRERRQSRRRRLWPWLVAVLYVLVFLVAPAFTDNYLWTVLICHGILCGLGLIVSGVCVIFGAGE